MDKLHILLAAFLLLLSLFLLAWSIADIIKRRKNKSIIVLLLLAPIIGPLIYFQLRGERNRQ